MTIEELREKVRLHGLWLQGDPAGQRADLQGANLYGTDLREANLQGANLYGANLQRADLRGADLQRADLRAANLREADLREANLREANLDQKQIAANLHRVSIVPEVGPFWAWKAVRCVESRRVVIVQLEVPAEPAGVGGLVGRKCRVSAAKVLSATLPDGTPFTGECGSDRDRWFRYPVGEVVTPDEWDPNPADECSHGIHVFLTRMEAVEYLAPDEARAMTEAALTAESVN